MTIDFTPDLYQTTSSEKLDGTRPDDVGPTAFLGTFF